MSEHKREGKKAKHNPKSDETVEIPSNEVVDGEIVEISAEEKEKQRQERRARKAERRRLREAQAQENATAVEQQDGDAAEKKGKKKSKKAKQEEQQGSPSSVAPSSPSSAERAIFEGAHVENFVALESFSAAGFHASLASLTSSFAAPTPVQGACWPPLMAGRDVVGLAETGSGKTLAFLLPALNALLALPSPPSRPALLVLAPTRELAMQTATVCTAAEAATRLKSICCCACLGISLVQLLTCPFVLSLLYRRRSGQGGAAAGAAWRSGDRDRHSRTTRGSRE